MKMCWHHWETNMALSIPANAIHKAEVLDPVHHVCNYCKFGNRVMWTNAVSRTCVLSDVNHLWCCCKL
jgi:hypothetical protein